MKTKRIIALSALALLFAAQSVAQTATTLTDYIPKGATYLFECSRIPFSGDDMDTTIGGTTLRLRERQAPVIQMWQDSIVRGATYLYGCDRFTTDTVLSLDTIRGWERDTIYTFSLKVSEPKRDTGEVLFRDTVCSGRKYLFGCEIIDTDSIFTTDTITLLKSEYWQSSATADTLYKLQLAVLPVYIDTVTNTRTDCDSVSLNGTMFYRDTVFTDTIVDQTTGCRTIMRYSATVNHSKDTTVDATICEGGYYVFEKGDTLRATKDTICTRTFETTHCDSTVTLHLSVTPAPCSFIDTTICQGREYLFGDTTLTTTGTYYRTVPSLATGCDSVITLRLTVQSCLQRREVSVTDTVCPGTEYRGRLTSHTITVPTSWKDSLRVEVDGMPTDSIYLYTITPYLLTLPAIPENSVIAYCGRAIDITAANDMVQKHIAALGDLYAPNAVITWQMSDNSTWRELPDTTAIPGGVHTVSVRCTVTSDCGPKDTTLTLPVVTPSPENDPTMVDVEAGSLYGNRLLLVNKHDIDSIYGWNIQPEHVVWYHMAGATPDVAADDSVHTGLYYTTDNPFEGNYYARITHESATPSDCGATLRTVILHCQKQSNVAAPQLTPTIARPAEQIRLFNLDAGAVTEIRVYNTAGELQSTYTSAEATEFLFRAAHSAGYYLVDVQTDNSKVTLRYIVK